MLTLAVGVALATAGPSLTEPAGAATPSPPNAPAARAVTSTVIRITWAAPKNPAGIVGYRLWRGPTPIAALPATSRGFLARGLAPSTEYLFAVRSVSASGMLSPATVAGARTFASPLVPDPRPNDVTPPAAATAILNGVVAAGRRSTVRYGPDPTFHLADVYRPDPGLVPSSGSPTILFLHGGGWTAGSRSAITGTAVTGPIVAMLARGWTVVSAGYRLAGPNRTSPTQIRDVRRAIKFLKSHARRFALNPKRVFVAGSSAGAHLALLAAASCRIQGTTTTCAPEFEPAGTEPWLATTDARVAGVVAIVPVTDVVAAAGPNAPIGLRVGAGALLGCRVAELPCRARAERLGPRRWLDTTDPPVSVAFGPNDTI
ncbi:MAG: alpha/beta hydrolase fold domain-containing protein, partial [Actinomycetota bacterium]